MIGIARSFAAALDAEDYRAARRCLAPDCRYWLNGNQINGADAILATYRANGESGKRRFDAIRYESRVVSMDAGRLRIEFADHLAIGGASHTYRCIQDLRVDEAGLILEIWHVELDGEREALERFVESHGSSG